MEETKRLLRVVFQTDERAHASDLGHRQRRAWRRASSTWSSPDDEVVIGVNGVFGTRMAEIVDALPARPWSPSRRRGATIVPDDVIAAALRAYTAPEARRAGARRDLDRRVAAARGDRPPGARGRRALRRRLRHLARRLSGRDRRVAASTPATAARRSASRCPPGLAPVTFGPRAVDGATRAKPEGAELVPRPDDDREVLGRGARLPPHGADLDELRPLRGAAAGDGRGTGGALRAATAPTTRRWSPGSRRSGSPWRSQRRTGSGC